MTGEWPKTGRVQETAGNREILDCADGHPPVVTDQPDIEAVAALLADETARRILVETRSQPMSAEALSERCGVSQATIYRRIEDLNEQNLIVEQTHPDEDGHHYSVYSAKLDRAVVEVTEDGCELTLSRRENVVDRFTRLVEEI